MQAIMEETSIVLSARDEADLRWYFGAAKPSPPGVSSNFGRMCEREGNKMNPRTAERPSVGAPWTELIECKMSFGSSGTNASEDMMISYLDTQRRRGRVSRALAWLPELDQQALEAHYSREAPRAGILRRLGSVAILSGAARRENRARAASGHHEPVEETLERLTLESKAGATREAARGKLEIHQARGFDAARAGEGSLCLRAGARSGEVVSHEIRCPDCGEDQRRRPRCW